MTGTPSDTIRTAAEVALAMRYTAGHVARARAIEPEVLATLLVTWADILDGAERAPLPAVIADRLPLSVEIDSSADMIAAECMIAGGRLDIPAGDTASFIAWLRECARQAATLGEMQASGERESVRHRVEYHPDDVPVPGLETAAGEHVTFALLDRLRARRAQRIDMRRPCDTEERP